MTLNGWLQIGLFLLAVLAVTPPLGRYMTLVFSRERTGSTPCSARSSDCVYRLTGVDETREMSWREYAGAVLVFSLVSMLALYLLMRVQHWLPFNPQGLGPVAPDLAFNTAASFTTNTNWQSYVPETTMSYLTQMAGLAYHNFVSAAAGIAARHRLHPRPGGARGQSTLGNFWVDLTRAWTRLLLPVVRRGRAALVSQGVVQNLRPYDTRAAARPRRGDDDGRGRRARSTVVREQVIAQGPVASQEVIKEFGTNGGGFFNANSAHPFENPTPLTNFLQMLADLRDPGRAHLDAGRHDRIAPPRVGGLGRDGVPVPGRRHHGLLGRGGAATRCWPPTSTRARCRPGGNMEGKEVRFGIANSALFATVTTEASCGAVNSMHDSFTPLGGMVPLVNIMLGEVIFGGVGAGLYGMLVFIVLSRVHRRADGRAHAGVPRARRSRPSRSRWRCWPCSSFRSRSWCSPASPSCRRPSARRASSTRARTASPRSSTPTRRGPATTARRSPASRRTRPGTTPRSAIAMLVGRFLIIVPCWRWPATWREEAGAAVAGHVPGHDAAVRGAAGLRDPHRRRPDLLPRAQPRAHRRAPADARGRDVLTMAAHARSRRLWEAGIVRPALARRRPQARPANDGPQPRDVRRRGRLRADDRRTARSTRRRPRAPRLRTADHRVAVADRAVRELRRSDGRGARQGAGRHAAQAPAARPSRTGGPPDGRVEAVPGLVARVGTTW